MIVVRNGEIVDVGPRSAHIAALEYEVFTDKTQMEGPVLEMISPRPDDSPNYAAVRCRNGRRYALTLAGAANILGYVPKEDYAYGNAVGCTLCLGSSGQ